MAATMPGYGTNFTSVVTSRDRGFPGDSEIALMGNCAEDLYGGVAA